MTASAAIARAHDNVSTLQSALTTVEAGLDTLAAAGEVAEVVRRRFRPVVIAAVAAALIAAVTFVVLSRPRNDTDAPSDAE